MILVDTSVWVDHLHTGEPVLAELLEQSDSPEAVRLLRRRLSDVVFTALLADEQTTGDASHEPVQVAA